MSGDVFGSEAGGQALNFGLINSDILSKEAVLPGRNDAEMGSANSLHVFA